MSSFLSPPQSSQPSPLSRTSSFASFSSIDDESAMNSATVAVISASRRTRKRFTNVQLSMLEHLFHQNHHPSREDREAVAKAGGMEIKSVTIWFQNKRQTERKTAASLNALNSSSNATSTAIPNITSTIHTFSLHNDSQNSSRTASPPFSVSSRSSASTTNTVRPSLDHVASRSELRGSAPRTPSRRTNLSGAIWDIMPSSPLTSPMSPGDQDFLDFGRKNAKTRMTLDYVCAARRAADKEKEREMYANGKMSSGFGGSDSSSAGHHHGYSTNPNGSSRSKSQSKAHKNSQQSNDYVKPGRDHGSSRSSPDGDLTEEEEEEEGQEAITPPSTWGKDDNRWFPSADGAHITRSSISLMALADGTRIGDDGELPKGVDDAETFNAALALCGLGRRT